MRVRVLLAMMPGIFPVNFSFPSIPSPDIHCFVEHLGPGRGVYRGSWDEFADRFWDGQAAEPEARRRVVRLQLGHSPTLRIIALATYDGVQGHLHRCRRAGHHPGYLPQACGLFSHPPALFDLLRGQSRWAPNTFPAGPGPVQAQFDPLAGRSPPGRLPGPAWTA